jgi:phospholipase/carboxylesterase
MATLATSKSTSVEDPHADQTVLHAGARLVKAHALLIMLHGRNSTARDIMSLAREVMPTNADAAAHLAFVATQAAGNTWYPQRFVAPLAENEPWLSSALRAVDHAFDSAVTVGIPKERTVLLGFSQGACLALEYAARFPHRFGGVIGLSGALIENGDRPRTYSGSLLGTPLFLGGGDMDDHIPSERIDRSERLLSGMGAIVTRRIYPGMGHTVNADEFAYVRAMLTALFEA